MNQNSKTAYSSLFTWNLWGSTVFELLKVLHNVIMLSILPGSDYGLIGTLFAGIYLAARFADIGAAASITPFFNLFVASKKTFRDLFCKRYILPVAPIIFIVGFLATIIAYKKCAHVPFSPALWIVPCLVIGESFRSIFRQFLHISFKSRSIILIELIIFIGYLGVVWAPIFFGFMKTFNATWIFVPYCIDSLVVITLFLCMVMRVYKGLPEENSEESLLYVELVKRMWKTRFFNYLTIINRELFTSNMLTPLFAVKFGLKQAGIFYFASMLARSLYGIIRSTITYPGNALLAHVKNKNISEKREAFKLVSTQVILIITPILVCLGYNFKKLAAMSTSAHCSDTITMFSVIYFVITFSELFFILYEQFYILEEASAKLFMFKGIEIILFYGLIACNASLSPLLLLIGIILLRLFTFLGVALNGFYQWGIFPAAHIPLRYIFGCVFLAVVTSIILSLV